MSTPRDRPDAAHGWGRRTSLFQWRQPAFWVYATVVVLTAVYAFAQQQIFQELSPSGWALSWALLIAYGSPCSSRSTSSTCTSASRSRS